MGYEQVILTASLVARHAGGPTMKNTTDAAGRPGTNFEVLGHYLPSSFKSASSIDNSAGI